MSDTTNRAATIDPEALEPGLAQEYAADIVERLNAEPLEAASAMLSAMPLERAAEVLDEPGLEAAAELIEAQAPERAIALLKAISADQRADIFRHFDASVRERLLAQLDAGTRASLIELLAYPANTAGSIMTTEFVSVPSTWTAGEALKYIREVESTRETIYAIYVVNPRTKALVRTLSLRRLISADPQRSLVSVALP
ncbi:MAG: magnesium transporter MgtE N-terminal domain-containing protein, partial [Terriglobales bacterium]